MDVVLVVVVEDKVNVANAGEDPSCVPFLCHSFCSILGPFPFFSLETPFSPGSRLADVGLMTETTSVASSSLLLLLSVRVLMDVFTFE